MAGKRPAPKQTAATAGRPSALLDTRIVYCGDCLDQLGKLPDGCVDLIYIDPPFNSNRNYEVFWGETKEKRAFEDRHASTQAYIDYMRPRCVELARVLEPAAGRSGHGPENERPPFWCRVCRPNLLSWKTTLRSKSRSFGFGRRRSTSGIRAASETGMRPSLDSRSRNRMREPLLDPTFHARMGKFRGKHDSVAR